MSGTEEARLSEVGPTSAALRQEGDAWDVAGHHYLAHLHSARRPSSIRPTQTPPFVSSTSPSTDDLAGAWASGLIALAAVAVVLFLALFTRFFKDR